MNNKLRTLFYSTVFSFGATALLAAGTHPVTGEALGQTRKPLPIDCWMKSRRWIRS